MVSLKLRCGEEKKYSELLFPNTKVMCVPAAWMVKMFPSCNDTHNYQCEEKFVILQSIEIIAIKSRKTRELISTPADILVDNLIPLVH